MMLASAGSSLSSPSCSVWMPTTGAASTRRNATAPNAETSGPLQDAAEDRAPDLALDRGAPHPAEPGHPAEVDAVTEHRQQGGQHGHRAEHRDEDDEDRGDREAVEEQHPGQEHPRHRHHHGQTGDQHRAAGRRCRDPQRRLGVLGPARAPRARGAGRTCSSRPRRPGRPAASPSWSSCRVRSRWLTRARMPLAARNDVSARPTGSTAARNAPKATSRIPSASGTAVHSARWKSLPIVSSNHWLADPSPNWSIRTSGCAAAGGRDGVEDRLHPVGGRHRVAGHGETAPAPSARRRTPARWRRGRPRR